MPKSLTRTNIGHLLILLIKCSCCRSNNPVNLSFCGNKLKLNKLVLHLGYILSSNLSDDEDIMTKRKDLCKNTNFMLKIFSCCDHLTNCKIL